MSDSTIKAIIFDMDGVLLDSESICDKTWEIARKEFGLPEGIDSINKCRGTNFHDSSIILRQLYGQNMEAEKYLERCSELFREIEFSSGIPLMPYAKEILEYLKPKYRIALASSTRGPSVKRQMTNAGLINFFETLTTGEMVTHSKPDPEIYRMSCKSLGLEPGECVAVEDSPNGARSALSAGMRTILIPDRSPATPDVLDKVWKLCKTLEDLKDFL
ncbi:MAG: HAD family phosphatase [Treponema sp.]|nr:HAD family phosphatase [Treponema sp.]